MNRQAIGWSCAAAAIIGALFTLASWATGATLMFLAPLVGCAAGVGYVAGLRGTATRVPAMMHGIAAAGITLVAILAGRVTLGWIDVRAWNERMSEVTGDDLHGVIAERIAARAIDAGEIDVDAEEYPDWVSDEADEELAAMSGEEVERLRAELQADGEEAAEAVSPLLLMLRTFVNIGFIGFVFLATALGTAYRIAVSGAGESSTDGAISDGGTLVELPQRADPMRLRAELPADPLAGTAAGSRSLTGEADERKAA
ncbi:MAG: hypothetical protein JNL80_08570 [Phycisphaerae bacterium]|jgi:hypothetical protein|nr:hypothetical protein [Phycisphaerae bacterium]